MSTSGQARVDIHDRLALLDGPNSILGRSIVIHEGFVNVRKNIYVLYVQLLGPDDLGQGGNAASLKTGNAGARVGCCVIRETFPVFSWKYFMSVLSNWNIIN